MKISGVRIVVGTALAVLVLGLGWLLHVLGAIDFTAWLWSAVLALSGVLVLLLVGLDKGTAVIGPWLLVWALLSALVRGDLVDGVVVLPALAVVGGLLLLAAPFLPLPAPRWLLG